MIEALTFNARLNLKQSLVIFHIHEIGELVEVTDRNIGRKEL